MTSIVITAIVFAFVLYLGVGLVLGRRTRGVADLLPLELGRTARVANSAEFSASTVATTISLATVVMAFFELAEDLGLWMLWAVVTTSMGLLLVRVLAGRIWQRMSVYDHRPTLHEFLSVEFGSSTLAYVGAVCTSIGFLTAFAVELTVGSKFFAGLVPTVSPGLAVVILSVVAFVYTGLGGFRAVIVTDRIQMISIWLLLFALPAFYIYWVITHGGLEAGLSRMPAGVLDLAYREDLPAFLLGIFVINVPAYISDMSIWQRIAGANEPRTVTAGTLGSVISAGFTWTIIVLLACFAFMLIGSEGKANPLVLVLAVVGAHKSVFAGAVLFLAALGLYGAMLSTASTQLIAVSHTLYEDVFSHLRKHPLAERLQVRSELTISRVILVAAAVVSTALVQILAAAGFSIADMVFAIYGAQLGLCPLVISAIFLSREKLRQVSVWAVAAVTCGFVTGWATAVIGRLANDNSLVFFAPVASLVVSTVLLGIGFVSRRNIEYQK